MYRTLRLLPSVGVRPLHLHTTSIPLVTGLAWRRHATSGGARGTSQPTSAGSLGDGAQSKTDPSMNQPALSTSGAVEEVRGPPILSMQLLSSFRS